MVLPDGQGFTPQHRTAGNGRNAAMASSRRAERVRPPFPDLRHYTLTEPFSPPGHWLKKPRKRGLLPQNLMTGMGPETVPSVFLRRVFSRPHDFRNSVRRSQPVEIVLSSALPKIAGCNLAMPMRARPGSKRALDFVGVLPPIDTSLHVFKHGYRVRIVGVEHERWSPP